MTTVDWLVVSNKGTKKKLFTDTSQKIRVRCQMVEQESREYDEYYSKRIPLKILKNSLKGQNEMEIGNIIEKNSPHIIKERRKSKHNKVRAFCA